MLPVEMLNGTGPITSPGMDARWSFLNTDSREDTADDSMLVFLSPNAEVHFSV